ncbi:MAG: trypsin-like peptidase domain-containing protein [Leptolyngbyaceae cyanobacterium]
MSFTREDYEHAIARIFYVDGQGKKHVVGTGFLVAPGYVLTCAHVVLQALGFTEDEFVDCQTAPKGTIRLDFLPNEYDIAATVVPTAWQPYGLNKGDIAALQLQAEPPERAKPIPLQRCACEAIQDELHSVYGFANENGDRSDAYKPKANAVGGRFQFHKEGDPQDDTIDAGFSGAPVWNQTRECVVGMVATAWVATTATDRRCKAYAIPEEQLRPVLNDLFARSLCDLVEQGLAEARGPVRNAVDRAFALCEEGRVERPTLLGRLQYLTELSNRDWEDDGAEVDRLTQFALFLAVMDGLPESLRPALKAWVRFRGCHYEQLYVRANEERQARDVSSAYAPEHLIVQIKPDEQNAANVKVWLWVIGDRNHYDYLEPPLPRLRDEVIPFTSLPAFLETWLEDESDLDDPMVHCFVARHRLGCDLDACETQDGLTLGSQYKLVLRTDLSQSPTGKQYYTRWQQKWEALEGKPRSRVRSTVVRSDCTNKARLLKQLRSAEMAILENLPSDRVEEIFEFLARKVGLPVALWVRREELCAGLDRLLDCAVMELPHKVYEERSEVLDFEGDDATCLGYHLSLVWEDLKVVPPTMMEQFDPEAC